ncbi:PREDICTED: uncharacterized protein LOC105141099 [Populus euphratica]|uniref:Uncharacterized protein LOC105141099 n=1 Tax=Populus euphratica TaxID=75702 RepID=A0AAJ6VDP5_POPEU|nr:PREDICTED: uncharacterized protein LOC105141099 [Populus euphratica]XP_011046507.1 PREDICTED: uncharacterized protein LOC105141099 [Populus euphratica]XP_011046508.1 PREDICTED: uncharacterized protein LOC105141099 [Populus euphratica]
MAAETAEKRLHDDLWCGSKSSDSATSIEGNVGRPVGSSTSVSSEGISAQTSPMTSMSGQESIGDHLTWQCNNRTLLNQPMALICEACGTQIHKDVAKFKAAAIRRAMNWDLLQLFTACSWLADQYLLATIASANHAWAWDGPRFSGTC